MGPPRRSGQPGRASRSRRSRLSRRSAGGVAVALCSVVLGLLCAPLLVPSAGSVAIAALPIAPPGQVKNSPSPTPVVTPTPSPTPTVTLAPTPTATLAPTALPAPTATTAPLATSIGSAVSDATPSPVPGSATGSTTLVSQASSGSGDAAAPLAAAPTASAVPAPVDPSASSQAGPPAIAAKPGTTPPAGGGTIATASASPAATSPTGLATTLEAGSGGSSRPAPMLMLGGLVALLATLALLPSALRRRSIAHDQVSSASSASSVATRTVAGDPLVGAIRARREPPVGHPTESRAGDPAATAQAPLWVRRLDGAIGAAPPPTPAAAAGRAGKTALSASAATTQPAPVERPDAALRLPGPNRTGRRTRPPAGSA